MKNLLLTAAVTLASISLFAAGGSNIGSAGADLIEQKVASKFIPIAKSLLQRADVREVRIDESGRVVLDVNTAGKKLSLTVLNGENSYKQKADLSKVMSIPFPGQNDIAEDQGTFAYPTDAFVNYLKTTFDYRLAGGDVLRHDELIYSVATLKHNPLFAKKQMVILSAGFTVSGSSFNKENLKFYTNRCDSQVCSGSMGVTLEVK